MHSVDPLVLRTIAQVLQAAAAGNCPVSICGEDPGDPAFAGLLVGLGARELSLSPARPPACVTPCDLLVAAIWRNLLAEPCIVPALPRCKNSRQNSARNSCSCCPHAQPIDRETVVRTMSARYHPESS